MEKRDVAVVPKQLQPGQMLVQVDVVPKDANMHSFGCDFEMPGYLLAFELLYHFALLFLQVGRVLELESFINYIVLGIVQKLKHFELVLEELVGEVVLGVGFEFAAWDGGEGGHKGG